MVISFFLCQLERFKLFINYLRFFTNIDLPQKLKLRCLCGFMFGWLIGMFFFLLHSSISILLRVLVFSFRFSPRAKMFEVATLLCSFFRLYAVIIIRLDIASGVSSSKRSLVPACSTVLQINIMPLSVTMNRK